MNGDKEHHLVPIPAGSVSEHEPGKDTQLTNTHKTSLGKPRLGTFFYNQPSYTHFNKSFDDTCDALFLHLNEVHPVFMKREQIDEDFEYEILLDPRTKKEVEQILYDHTFDGQQRKELFRSSTPSNLSKTDHLVCLRLLKAWQEFREVNEADVLHWRRIEQVRKKEKIAFDQFVMEYSRTRKRAIYAPCERLVMLYKRFYSAKVNKLLAEYPENLPFNTHVGLPQPQSLTGSQSGVYIENVRLIRRQGWVPILRNYVNDFQHLNLRLENHIDNFIDSMNKQENFKWELNMSSNRQADEFYIPIESLIFLLTADNFADSPSEVPLEISESSGANFKTVTFDEPLPPRSCGWFAHKQIIENAFDALLSTSKYTRWLYMENDSINLQKSDEAPEISGVNSTETGYTVYEFNEYLKKHAMKVEDNIKTNFAVVQWNLSGKMDESDSHKQQFFTRLKLAPAMDELGTEFLSSLAFKLEYKPKFGAEVMTKYELIREWFRLKLLGQCKGFSNHVLCLRLAVNDFSVQLEHKLVLSLIEKQLAETYHIDMPKLLAGLAETLQLLVKMPAGKYLLRYNPKYPNKLLLAAPSKEITLNTVFVHSLLNVVPSDLAFMTEEQHLPISDVLCSAVHTNHNIMPCAFRPCFQAKAKKNPTMFSDEEYLKRRLEAKEALEMKKKAEYLHILKTRRNQVKAKKRKQRQKRKGEEQAKDKKMEQFLSEF
ncbi:unnamed protein product [Ceratitis capitata]|uniref:(Mediterranean fruit fly) hypothetical protein n=1 Tax=Ceratitis capitata TaxID=7213 RepID=A0A811U472_CERCA|nr:unnamed protein product [Ceratitis capitata]